MICFDFLSIFSPWCDARGGVIIYGSCIFLPPVIVFCSIPGWDLMDWMCVLDVAVFYFSCMFWMNVYM